MSECLKAWIHWKKLELGREPDEDFSLLIADVENILAERDRLQSDLARVRGELEEAQLKWRYWEGLANAAQKELASAKRDFEIARGMLTERMEHAFDRPGAAGKQLDFAKMVDAQISRRREADEHRESTKQAGPALG